MLLLYPIFYFKSFEYRSGIQDSAVIIAMTCYVPTPGSAGVLLWRFITYYLLMFISFIVYLIFESYASHRRKSETEVEEEIN